MVEIDLRLILPLWSNRWRAYLGETEFRFDLYLDCICFPGWTFLISLELAVRDYITV